MSADLKTTSNRTSYVALLRAMNVGGTGMLPMSELSALCIELGFEAVRTYIQSGNVVLTSNLAEQTVRTKLAHALAHKTGKKIDVMVRTGSAMQHILEANPFKDKEPAKVAVAFLAEGSPAPVDEFVTPGGEQVHAGRRETYIYYPGGMGRSKLKFPASMKTATLRNINTIAKLVSMSA